MIDVAKQFFGMIAAVRARAKSATLDGPSPAGTDATSQVVFIDLRTPDLADLVMGAKPGERVFVIHAKHDGLEQIAHILKAHHLTGLSAISIVGHGAAGSIRLGSTLLDDGDLAAHKAALAAIGAALAPKGQLDLYACDVAAGPAGHQFIADLSHYAKGANVAAATHDIGKTSHGADWTLDAATGAKATGTPFTAAAIQSYQGTLSSASGPDGQLTIGGIATTGRSYLNSDSLVPVTESAADTHAFGLAIDPALGALFEITADSNNMTQLNAGALGSSAAPTASSDFKTYFTTVKQADGNTLQTDTANGNTGIENGLAIDPSTHTLYVPIGSTISSENGYLAMTYSVDSSHGVSLSNIHFAQTTGTSTVSSSNPQQPTFFPDATFYNGVIYSTDYDRNDSTENGLYRVTPNGVRAPAALVDPALFPTPTNSSSPYIRHLALDHADDRLYFNTSQSSTNNGLPTSGTLYVVKNASTETGANFSNGNLAALSYASGVTPPTYYFLNGLAFDDNSNTLYLSDNGTSSQPGAPSYVQTVNQIDALHLDSTGTVVNSISVIHYSDYSGQTATSSTYGLLNFNDLSALTVAGTAATVQQGGAAVTLLSRAPGVTDFNSGGFLQSASVSITKGGTFVSGDVLGLAKGGAFNQFTSTATSYVDNGHTFLVSYSGGTLTIANAPGSSGENTIDAYRQVLADVQYQDGSTVGGPRTATFQVNNGAIGNPSGPINTKSFGVVVAQPPTIVAGGYAVPGYVVESATANAASPGALTGDTDPNGGSLSVTAVDGSAGGVANPVDGTYGTLTLQANGAYSYSAGNTTAIDGAATGSHPVDSYTFTVTNAGGSANEAFAVTIDRAPTTVMDTQDAQELGAPVTGNVLDNDSDHDGDTFDVSAISTNGMAGTFGQPLAGTYGDLTLNADGTYSYTANNVLAYATATGPRTDDFTYTASDGLGGLTQQTLEFNVLCFASGTCIRTTRGEVAVEDLAVGDLAVTASGAHRPIRWLGHREVDCASASVPSEVWPVRIRAGAFGYDLPERDLLLSPGHPVLVGSGASQHLVPIMCLINGTSVARMPVERITYWHVELDAHDILLAEGLPAESFLDYGNRPWFEEAADHALTNPDHIPPGLGARCRPVAFDGPVVEAQRRRLDALFGMRLAAASHWPDASCIALHV